MAMAGQTINDRLLAARHSLAGQGLAKSVCKATTEEMIGPKKKHLDCKYPYVYTNWLLPAQKCEENVDYQLINLIKFDFRWHSRDDDDDVFIFHLKCHGWIYL